MGRNLAEFPFNYNIGDTVFFHDGVIAGQVEDRIECNKLDKDIASDQEATLFDEYKVKGAWYETWELRSSD